MNDSLPLAAISLATAVGLVMCYGLAAWVSSRRTLRAAARIARSLATEQALLRASPMLRDSLERYRVAKVRANLGAPSALHAAAAALVREHRLSALERR